MANFKRSIPSPVTLEISKNGRPRFSARQSQRRHALRILRGVHFGGHHDHGLGRQIFAEAGQFRPSRFRNRAPDRARSISETSTRCASSRVRSMCRRNWMPRPWPRCAPSISPGISATTKLRIVVHLHHAQIGLERGERIVGDLGPRRGDARDQGGFAGVGKSDQPHVGQQLQFQPQALLLARLAGFVLGGRLVRGGGEARVALAAACRRAPPGSARPRSVKSCSRSPVASS